MLLVALHIPIPPTSLFPGLTYLCLKTRSFDPCAEAINQIIMFRSAWLDFATSYRREFLKGM